MRHSPGPRPLRHRLLAAATLLTLGLTAAACGDDPAEPASGEPDPAVADPGAADAAADIRVVSPSEAAALQADPPADLVVLDVRTPEEFAEGHLDDATLLDFYRTDFAGRVAELDRDRPYLLYCRSGNRSGQTRARMEQLGFTDVTDVDGGIAAWTAAGLPVTTG